MPGPAVIPADSPCAITKPVQEEVVLSSIYRTESALLCAASASTAKRPLCLSLQLLFAWQMPAVASGY